MHHIGDNLKAVAAGQLDPEEVGYPPSIQYMSANISYYLRVRYPISSRLFA